MQKVITEFEDGLVVVPITAAEVTTYLSPETTYVYDLVLTRSDGTVDTLNPTDKFFSYFTVKRGVLNGWFRYRKTNCRSTKCSTYI